MADFDLNALMANPSFAAGLGLLAASGRNNMSTGQRIASGLLGGMHTSQQGQLFSLKMAENKKKQEQEASKQEAIKNLLASLSPQFDPTAALAAGEEEGDTGPTMTNAARVTPGKQMDYNTAMQLQLMGGPDLSGIIGKMNDGPKLETIYNEKGLETKSRWNPETKTFEQVGGAKATPLHFANLGGQTAGLDPFTGQQQVALQNTMSPESKASNSLGWANYGLSKDRLSFDKSQEKGGGKAPAGYRWSADGSKLTPIPGGPAATKPMTQDQGNAMIFGRRAAESDSILNDLEGKYSRASLGTRETLGNTWVIGPSLGAIGNIVASKESQQAEQAQRNFINAVLRRESGAAIAPTEFESAKKQYFPSVGDSEAVVKQKAANRKATIESLKTYAAGVSPTGSASGGWGIEEEK